jgi:uncharacterized protein YbjT (DUF2867 family)
VVFSSLDPTLIWTDADLLDVESWLGYAPTIKKMNVFFTSTEDGKLGFVSADDIVDVAAKALLDEKSHNTDHYIVGPQLLSYAEVRLPSSPLSLRFFLDSLYVSSTGS